MEWNNPAVKQYYDDLPLAIEKKNYTAALDFIKDIEAKDAKKKSPCMIDGVKVALHHLTVGVSPYTVTVFFDYNKEKIRKPVIWGLGNHDGSNTEYLVKWNAGKAKRVSLK